MTAIISKAAAKAAGLKRYFTGKPCRKGHIGPRQVSNGMCSECEKARHLHRQQTDPIYAANKVKRYEAAARRYATDVNYRTQMIARSRQLRTGMPPEIWHKLLIDQAGCCAICDKPMMSNNKNYGACADHDHINPGVFRGLLCSRCNTAIHILENPKLLPCAQAYLAEHNYTARPFPPSIPICF